MIVCDQHCVLASGCLASMIKCLALIITRCPICAYTKKLGVSELMPLFCEPDEVMITLQHGVLHRKQTLADGGKYCDYFITGDKEKV